MGTSRVDRSPATPAWGLVNAFYTRPIDEPRRVLVDLLNAGREYESGLADPAVLARVEAALAVGQVPTARPNGEGAASVARAAVADGVERALAAGTLTFYGDLADRALHMTVLDQARFDRPTTSVAVVRKFLTELLGITTDHLVSRDITAVLGAAATRTVDDIERYRQALVDSARSIGEDPDLAADVRAAARSPADMWGPLVSKAWAKGRSRRTDPSE